MPTPLNDPSPVAEAMTWVARITAVGMMMVLPGLGGLWLDKHLGIGFLGLVGFAAGMIGGLTYLIAMTRQPSKKDKW